MVIDTMVFAYALLRVEAKHKQAIAALETAAQIIVPNSLFAELGNLTLSTQSLGDMGWRFLGY